MARARSKKQAGLRTPRSPLGPPRGSSPAREAPTRADRALAVAVPTAVGLIAFATYFATAARDIFPGDSPEFVTVGFVGGVAHAPGYPLLAALAVLFAKLPLDPLPFRVNVIAVLCHTATIVLVYLTAERIGRRPLPAAAAALVVAFGTGFWRWSLVAETFPLNDLLVSIVIYLLVVWRERPRPATLYGAAAAFGLGFANQQTIVLLAPAILIFLFNERASLRDARVFATALAFAAGAALVPYVYIVAAASRHPVLNWGSIESLPDLLRSMLRLDYGSAQLVPSSSLQGGSGLDRLGEFAKSVNIPLLILAAVGTVQAYRRERWYLAFTAIAFVVTGPLFIAYSNANPAIATVRFVLERFYLLPQLVVAPLAALGLVYVGDEIRRRVETSPRGIGAAVAGVGITVAVLEVTLGFGAMDRRDDHVARNFAEDILNSTPQNAVILSSGDHVFLPLLYMHEVEHMRPDVTLISWPLLGLEWYQREIRLRYPKINLPVARYGEPDGLLTFVRSNLDKTIVLTGEEIDQSLEGKYGFFPRGLALPLTDTKHTVDLNELADENKKLLDDYRIPSLNAIDQQSFERFIVVWYGLVPYRIGFQFEQAKLYADARTWYQRSLSIDPELPEAVIGLQRIQGK